jgi:uncharacterized membrane protein YqaE (UPF0057 family)
MADAQRLETRLPVFLLLALRSLLPAPPSMGMLVSLCLMPRMIMIVKSVLSGVAMVVNFRPFAMGVFMKVFMKMFMGMGVGMLVAMFLPVVGVFVRVSMGMLVAMQMFMFVFSFHF